MSQNYTPQQVADAMRQAGFNDSAIPTGVAIATAESGRRASAANTNGENSYGIWQINLDFWGKPNTLLAPLSQGCVADLSCSTKAAYVISRGGTDWSAWTTFTSGKYLEFLSASPTPSTTSPSVTAPSSLAVPPLQAATGPAQVPSVAARLTGSSLASTPLIGGLVQVSVKAVITVGVIFLIFVGVVKIVGGDLGAVAKKTVPAAKLA